VTLNVEHRPLRDPADMQSTRRQPATGAPAPTQRTSSTAADNTIDHTPPQDLAAEQCVLGGMLLSKDTIGDVIDVIGSKDLYRPIHATIFDAIVALYSRGEPVDAITVADHLTVTRDLARVGGAPYLHTLLEAVPTAANAAYYARIVKEKAEQRRLIEIGTKVVQIGHQGRRDADDDPVDRAGQLFFDAVGERDTGAVSTVDLIKETFDEIQAAGRGDNPGLPTGLYDLDDLLSGGLRGGQLILIAGRPGSGKSVASMDVARHNALRHGKGVEVFNLEMSRSEVMMRVLSAECGVPFTQIRRGQLTDGEWDRLLERGGEISESGLHIDDFASQTLTGIRARARRRAQRGDLDLIVVDYLQLMTVGRRVESRQQEVAEISRGLKLLAKELNVPVIACSQLNRGPEQRTDKRPGLSDLRESGSQEQDADIVILLHRPDYHDKESERAGEVDFIVAKHRGGPTDTVTASAQLHMMRFQSFALDAR
jgi:replicative DNA helicase